jgi:hypothetical protein
MAPGNRLVKLSLTIKVIDRTLFSELALAAKGTGGLNHPEHLT